MRFNPKARLDRGRVRDRGRGGGGAGGGLGGALGGSGRSGGLPTSAIGGGGLVVTVIVVVLYMVLTQCGGSGGLGGPGGAAGYDTSRVDDAGGTARYDACETGEDANRSADCARVAVENSLVDFWSDELGGRFEAEQALVTFTGQVATGCGAASSDVGPFYCPVDSSIYLDTAFFDEVLERQLGGPDGGFVEAYVLAHEFGHHVQNLRGTMSQVRTQQGPESDAVRLELQADCFAGMWARSATSTEDAEGEVLVSELTDADVRLALEAAGSVGDDRIQEKTSGQVTEETWTHGSADQRETWFRTGFDQGSLEACDTFSADAL